MKEYGCSEACQVIGKISGPSITFKIKNFKILGERCLHNLMSKGRSLLNSSFGDEEMLQIASKH